MAKDYQPQQIEPKWRQYWQDKGLAKAFIDSKRTKYYCLDMFPYPSGEGLHVGHWRGYVLSDTWTRYQLMMGKSVLHPMGWDAFGLPAENRAIKDSIHPKGSTTKAIANMKRQLIETGALYDWSREINTSHPDYYRWTQWLFLQLYHNGLAYRQEAEVNWCPNDKTVLANEQVIDSSCERCGAQVTKKLLKQWFFRITAYADELLDFSQIDWPQRVKTMQTNWIGKSEGGLITFAINDAVVQVFTTRPDTLFGASYVVLAPENKLVDRLKDQIANWAEVAAYRQAARTKSEIERVADQSQKTGVRLTGLTAVNPINNQELPVWIADYVLASYGTGAIMAVPAHDQRDFDFAKQFGLSIVRVIESEGSSGDRAAEDQGILTNSGQYNGLDNIEAGRQIVKDLKARDLAEYSITYHLRDWLISRQRYWGTPIPIIYCDEHGEVPVPEDQLPVELPYEADFKPSGKSPLARDPKFVKTTCPICRQPAKRETDTMDTFVDSSWYYLRYCDPKNQQRVFDPELVRHWMPVDLYIGGIEHAILHLLYARFFTKALADIGLVKFREPFKQLFNIGIIHLHGKKMSKSKGNVVNPDTLVQKYGADTLRGYELFIAPADQDTEWNVNGVAGVYRFLHRAWQLITKPTKESEQTLTETHQLIDSISNDFASFSFNTIVSSLMSYLNAVENRQPSRADLRIFVQLMAPVFPHFAEEAWQQLGQNLVAGESIFRSEWPQADPQRLRQAMAILAVQINGRLRGTIKVAVASSQAEVEKTVAADRRFQSIAKQTIEKIIYIPGRIINFVIK